MQGVIISLFLFVLVIISGWLKILFLFISKGIIGNRLPWLYIVLPFSLILNSSFNLNTMNILGLILGLFATFLLMKKGLKTQEDSGLTNTVAQCATVTISGIVLAIVLKIVIPFF
jgi:hypothetical protein